MTGDPTSGHTAAFRAGQVKSEPDGRLYSGTFERNAKPVIDGLSPFLNGVTGAALEIGSGTGQHVIAFARAFPGLRWTPSEPDEIHRASIDAWRAYEGSNTEPAIAIDAAADWAATLPKTTRPLRLILSMNVVHISPFTVTKGIVSGAGRALAKGGLLVFYGPFQEGGQHTGKGNATFDARLRADNPEWGLRDIDEIIAVAKPFGMCFLRLIEMPANNRLLILKSGTVI